MANDSSDSDIVCIFDTVISRTPTKSRQDISGDSIIILSDSPLPTPPVPKIDLPDGRTILDTDSAARVTKSDEPWQQLFHSAEKSSPSSVRLDRPSFASPGVADIAINLEDEYDYNVLFERSASRSRTEKPGGYFHEVGAESSTVAECIVNSRPDFGEDDFVASNQPPPNAPYVDNCDRNDQEPSSSSLPRSSSSSNKPVRKRKSTDDDSQRKLEERELKRLQKEMEKETKRKAKEERDRVRKDVKLDKETAKLERKALREAYRPVQGGKGSLEHVTCHLPSSMIDAMGRQELILAFEESGPGFRYTETDAIGEQAGIIFWTREHVTAAVERTAASVAINTTKELVQESHLVVQIPKKNFVAMVDFDKQKTCATTGRDSFHSYIDKFRRNHAGKSLHFIVYGMERYFKNQLNKIVDNGNPSRRKAPRPSIAEIPYDISYDDVERSMLNVMCSHNIVIKQLENPKEVARYLVLMHKAIAYTHAKSVKTQETFLFDALSANTKTRGVTVSEDSMDGYRELWIRQLEQFAMVSRDVAITIVNAHASPRILMKAYDGCASEREKEHLLEDLVVKRGKDRRLGPKMSKMLYRYMCSVDGDEILE